MIILLWATLAIYVTTHKKELLASITKQLNENINGVLTVERMEPTLVEGFPAVSVSLSNVLLRDTAYHLHHHDLLKARELSITVNALSLLKGSPKIRNVRVQDGELYLFTDSTGYSNTNLFVKKETRDSAGKKPQPRINHFFFDNVHFIYENKSQQKYFNFEIARLEGKFDYRDTGWVAQVGLKTLVRQMAFYTPFGPFLKNKKIAANFVLNYNDNKGILDIPVRKIEVDDDDVSIGATIFTKADPLLFNIAIRADKIGFKEGRAILSTHIAGKLAIVDIKDPVAVQVSIRGTAKKKDQPLVYVRWQVADNVLTTNGATIENCSFRGYFYNKVNPDVRICDENSVIAVNNFKGSWENIDFTADSVRIDNLIRPVLAGHFKSNFDLKKLNPVLDNKTIHLEGGKAKLDLYFKGGIASNDATQPFITGTISINNAAMTYRPRNLSFTNSSLNLSFRGSDLFVDNVRLQNGSNVLSMSGSMRNMLNLYYTAPEKILLDWNIRSPVLNLNEYKSFLGRRGSSTSSALPVKKKSSKSVSRFSNQLDQVLERSSVTMRMEIGKILYERFTAANIVAAVNLNQAGIDLDEVRLNHAGGQISLKGHIDQSGPVNNFRLNARVDKVRVNEFFAAFNNFNQQALTAKNIQGNLFVEAAITGAVTDKGVLVSKSLKGTASFDLQNSALVDFEPLKNIGRYVFRRRNLSFIKIISLKDKLEIDGEKIKIYPLSLSSDAINADIAGIYSFGKGTDINVDVPLRNPKGDELILDDSIKLQKRMRGLVVHLNVADGSDGKMKIKLVGRAIPSDGEEPTDGKPKKKRRRNLLGF